MVDQLVNLLFYLLILNSLTYGFSVFVLLAYFCLGIIHLVHTCVSGGKKRYFFGKFSQGTE